MSLVRPSRAIEILATSNDPKSAIMEIVAPALPKLHVCSNMVLVATYIRSEKTAGGIYRPQTNLDEDQWQGKVGLILKKGPEAFVNSPEYTFHSSDVADVGDWVVYRVGDGWEVLVQGTTKISCRMVRDTAIRMKVADPEVIL